MENIKKVLKKATTGVNGEQKKPVSLWMRNIQMAFFSVVISKSSVILNGRALLFLLFHNFELLAHVEIVKLHLANEGSVA